MSLLRRMLLVSAVLVSLPSASATAGDTAPGLLRRLLETYPRPSVVCYARRVCPSAGDLLDQLVRLTPVEHARQPCEAGAAAICGFIVYRAEDVVRGGERFSSWWIVRYSSPESPSQSLVVYDEVSTVDH